MSGWRSGAHAGRAHAADCLGCSRLPALSNGSRFADQDYARLRALGMTACRDLIDEIDLRDYELPALRSAIGLVQQDSFLFSVPQGHDSVLGERGVNVSGGQRQRLHDRSCPARAPSHLAPG